MIFNKNWHITIEINTLAFQIISPFSKKNSCLKNFRSLSHNYKRRIWIAISFYVPSLYHTAANRNANALDFGEPKKNKYAEPMQFAGLFGTRVMQIIPQ